MNGSAGAFLPEADHVASGVTAGRDPQISFGVGRLDDLATLRHHLLEGVVDALDVDVGQQTGDNALDGLGSDPENSAVLQGVPIDILQGDLCLANAA